MTSPRLSTVGTISAIEKALDELDWRLALAVGNQPAGALVLPRKVAAKARAELAGLQAQLVHEKAHRDQALRSREGMRIERDQARAALAELRAQPVEAAYRKGWKRGWLNGHTSTINEGIVDLCWDRSQARANQPEASLQNLQISTGQPDQEQALQALADEAQAMGLYDKPEPFALIPGDVARKAKIVSIGTRFTEEELVAQPEQAMEPLGAEFSAVWDANAEKLHESEPVAAENEREVERREMFDLRGDAGHSWGLFAEREYAESTLRIISDFSVRVIPVEVFVRELEPRR